jgi:hypothetical protein
MTRRRWLAGVAALAGGLASLDARQAAQSPAATPALSPDRIERFLAEAEVVKATPIGKGITKPWRLTLKDEELTHDAAFQSVNRAEEKIRFRSGKEERKFRDYYGYNIAAYRLARLLGYDDLVPVAVERRWRGNTGALVWWIDAKWDEEARLKSGVAPPNKLAWENQIYLARVFTTLIEDTDRNLGNQLVTEDYHLWLIDFTRAFRTSRTLAKSATLRRCERRMFDRLQAVTDEEIRKAVRPYVDGEALVALLARRDALVEHFKKAAAERGEGSVFY